MRNDQTFGRLFDNYHFVDGAKFTTTYKDKPFNYIIEHWSAARADTKEITNFYLIELGTNLITFEFDMADLHVNLSSSANYIKDVLLKDNGQLGIKEGIDEARALVGAP